MSAIALRATYLKVVVNFWNFRTSSMGELRGELWKGHYCLM